MALETGVQYQVKSYQTLKKWYLIPPYLTLSSNRYVWRVKWSDIGKGVAPSPTHRCCSYWKGSLRVFLTNLFLVAEQFVGRVCHACRVKYTVKHIHIECTDLAHIRETFYSAKDMNKKKSNVIPNSDKYMWKKSKRNFNNSSKSWFGNSFQLKDHLAISWWRTSLHYHHHHYYSPHEVLRPFWLKIDQ